MLTELNTAEPTASTRRPTTHPLDPPVIIPLAQLEREAVVTALRTFDGHRSKAAAALGISVRTIQRKMQRWGIVVNTVIESTVVEVAGAVVEKR